MAGDELVWEKYQKEHGRELEPWNSPHNTDGLFRLEYLNYRKKFNLPARISTILGCDWVDLSCDGRSNTGITLETIAYLNSYTKEEKQNCHVIIGWTCISRILKYAPSERYFVDLTSQHYTEHHVIDPVRVQLKNHIKTQILGGDDQDFILDYLKNVMLLENYLISNNISYTFYRAIDDGLYEFKNVGPLNSSSFTTLELKVEDCTNHNNWYKFDKQNSTPINGLGWSKIFDAPIWYVTPTNGHPGFNAIYVFSAKLINFIKAQAVL